VFNELDQNKSIISIPSQIYNRVKDITKKTDFESVSQYVTFLLRTILMEQKEEKLEKIDENKIKSKLAKLGYI